MRTFGQVCVRVQGLSQGFDLLERLSFFEGDERDFGEGRFQGGGRVGLDFRVVDLQRAGHGWFHGLDEGRKAIALF
jgi:hypothetical protein